MPKHYYWDSTKLRYIARIIVGGKTIKHLGSFKKELDADNAVKKYIQDNIIVMPTRPTRKHTTKYTLRNALDFFESLNNATGSKKNWQRSMTVLTAYFSAFNDPNATTQEMAQELEDVDILPMLKDFDATCDLVENKIKNRKDGQDIAIDTKKQYFIALSMLFSTRNTTNGVVASKELADKYSKKANEYQELSHKNRDTRRGGIRGNALHPDLTWTDVQTKYQEFVTTADFRNNTKGLANLRRAVVVGLYVLRRPRRVTDYELLQFYSVKPSEAEMKGKNIIVVEDDSATLYIDVFKTRTVVRHNKEKELLPRYEAVITGQLLDLIRDYILKAGIQDMSKRTLPQKRANEQFYMFHKETGSQKDKYAQGGFSDAISKYMKVVFGLDGLSVNTMRHCFADWLQIHLKEYDNAQLKEIAVDVGDTPKSLPTNLGGYRMPRVENEGMDKTEIEGMLHENDYAEKLHIHGKEGGDEVSVGNVEDEVMSPKAREPMTEIDSGNNEDLLKLLADLEVQKMKILLKLFKAN